MENIPNIELKPILIKPIGTMDIPKYVIGPSLSIPTAAPITNTLGFPIVNLPGCVEYNKENNPKNTSLLEDDPQGTLIFCDGTLPSFNPINFNAEDYIEPPKTSVPKYENSEIETPQIKPPAIPKTEVPVVTVEEEEPIPEEINSIVDYLPPVEAVVSTTVIAAAAATSALVARPLANFLLKIIKPVVKKVIRKVYTKLGKEEVILSVRERREEQREKCESCKAMKKLRGR